MNASPPQNCFDPLRHFAAFLVLFSHHFALSGRPEPTFPSWDTLGFVAVAIFFAISGFLMPQSFASAGDFPRFLAKRCRRIFPGLVVCSFIMVYVIGAAFSASELLLYLLDKYQAGTFLSFAVMQGRPIPTVFSDFIYKNAINGSLWTLPVEFGWYLVIGAALAMNQTWKTAAVLLWLSALAVMTLSYAHYDVAFYGVPATFFALFGVSFATGALLSMTRATWMPYRLHLVGVALLIFVVTRGVERQVMGTAGLALITVVVGTSFQDKLIRGRFDISYGVYIYAFPIQQIVINRLVDSFWMSMIVSALLTTMAGTISYYLVERRFLHRTKSSLHRVEESFGQIAVSLQET